MMGRRSCGTCWPERLIGQPLRGHALPVNGLAYSQDGRLVADVSDDHTMMLWDVAFESWQAHACHIAGRNLTLEEWQQYLGAQPYHLTCPDLPGQGAVAQELPEVRARNNGGETMNSTRPKYWNEKACKVGPSGRCDMKMMRALLKTSQMAALCLACAVLLSTGEVYASPAAVSAGRLSYAPSAIPVLGGCGGSIAYDQPVRNFIEPGNELCFEFRGAAGDVISASMTRLDGDLDPLLKLWGADGVLAMDDDSGGDRNSLIVSFTLPESGAYALLASGFDASSSGNFELLLTRAAAAQPTPMPTSTPAAAAPCGGAIAYGEPSKNTWRLATGVNTALLARQGIW